MNRFTVSPAARSDLRKIWFYTAENWSAEQADRYVKLVDAAFRRLAAGETSGRNADEFRRGYLRLTIESHLCSTGLMIPAASKSCACFTSE